MMDSVIKKMYVLGTGTAVVSKYVNTACVFDDGKDLFLVDGTGGTDVLRCFDVMNLDWSRLHHGFLSHEHTDHFLGMIWVLRYIGELILDDRYEGDFTLYGHKEVLDKARKVCQMLLKPQGMALIGDRIHLMPVEHMEEKNICNYKFEFFDIGSTKAKQYGFHMVWPDGTRLVFPGDEPLSESGEQFCDRADWLLSEAFCLYRDREIFRPERYHHMTVRESSLMAEKHQVKNLLLWHTEDEATYGNRKELYTKEAAGYYSGKIWVPDDGEIIDL